MSKKKNKVRGNDNKNNDRNLNEVNDIQNASNNSRDAKDKRRHDNIKKEEQHRWPKQL